MEAVRLMHTLCRFVALGVPAASPHDHVRSVPPEKRVAPGRVDVRKREERHLALGSQEPPGTLSPNFPELLPCSPQAETCEQTSAKGGWRAGEREGWWPRGRGFYFIIRDPSMTFGSRDPLPEPGKGKDGPRAPRASPQAPPLHRCDARSA